MDLTRLTGLVSATPPYVAIALGVAMLIPLSLIVIQFIPLYSYDQFTDGLVIRFMDYEVARIRYHEIFKARNARLGDLMKAPVRYPQKSFSKPIYVECRQRLIGRIVLTPANPDDFLADLKNKMTVTNF